MLTIRSSRSDQFCDRVTRRQFLKVGGLALGGLTLTDILAAEAQAGIRSSHKAIIMIYLSGGPSHQDMYDLKMEAPVEIRGSFRPIQTNVPGIEICEHMPRLAKMADRYVLVRGMVGSVDEHSYSTAMTGFPEASLKSSGGRPSVRPRV